MPRFCENDGCPHPASEHVRLEWPGRTVPEDRFICSAHGKSARDLAALLAEIRPRPSPGTCRFLRCTRDLFARGFCQRHYTRVERAGLLELLGTAPRSQGGRRHRQNDAAAALAALPEALPPIPALGEQPTWVCTLLEAELALAWAAGRRRLQALATARVS